MPQRYTSLSSSLGRWSGVVLASTFVFAIGGGEGCSSGGGSAEMGACTPGAQVSCSCPHGALGVQVCSSAGSSLGACDCGTGPDASQDTGAADVGSGKPTHDGGHDSGHDSGRPKGDGATADSALDGSRDGGTCDPIAQTGCAGGQKCAWVETQSAPVSTGALECVPAGAAALNATCSYGPAGATTGYDTCAKGLACYVSGSSAMPTGACYAICDTSVETGPGACAANYECSLYSGIFNEGGASADGGVASTLGLCTPTCDPLTQTLSYNGAAACGGGTTGGNANLGCYGDPSTTTDPSTFTCGPDVDPTETSDDPVTVGPYVNSCAPGYVPLFYEGWQSSTVICSALCEPGATSVSAPANATGLAGSGHTCPDAGAGGTHECRYWWWLEGAATPVSAYSNTLGVCVDYTLYKYDSNGNGTIDSTDANWPSCSTLSSSGHTFSTTATDTQEWGCEPIVTRPML